VVKSVKHFDDFHKRSDTSLCYDDLSRGEMIMVDALEIAVVDLKGKIAEQVAALRAEESWREIQRLHAGLNALEEICKLPRTDLATVLGIGSDDRPKIKQYEFAGLPPLEAAKQYLRKIAPNQKAASLVEILAALESGDLKGVNRDDLRISLSRSTTEIYKAGDDIYGLVDSFPHIKRGTPGRKKSTNGATAGAVEEIMKIQVPISVEQAEAEAATESESDKS
jgi:hypothetical protein